MRSTRSISIYVADLADRPGSLGPSNLVMSFLCVLLMHDWQRQCSKVQQHILGLLGFGRQCCTWKAAFANQADRWINKGLRRSVE